MNEQDNRTGGGWARGQAGRSSFDSPYGDASDKTVRVYRNSQSPGEDRPRNPAEPDPSSIAYDPEHPNEAGWNQIRSDSPIWEPGNDTQRAFRENDPRSSGQDPRYRQEQNGNQYQAGPSNGGNVPWYNPQPSEAVPPYRAAGENPGPQQNDGSAIRKPDRQKWMELQNRSAMEQAAAQKNRQRENRKKLIWILLGVAAMLALLVLGIVLMLRGQDEDGDRPAGTTAAPAWGIRVETEPPKPEPVSTAPTPTEAPATAAPVFTERPDPETEAAEPLPSVGQIVTFGRYEQDNDYSNGPEGIEWIVLRTEGNRALLLSRSAIERRTFQTGSKTGNWSNSWLRDWLNGEFLKAAFSAAEQDRLAVTKVVTAPNPKFQQTDPGVDTYDRVFLLSYEEAMESLHEATGRLCAPSAFVIAKGAYVSDGACWWWLRTPGEDESHIMGISTRGQIQHEGIEVFDTGSVRPAVWVVWP